MLKVTVDVNDRIKKGQVLVVLDTAKLRGGFSTVVGPFGSDAPLHIHQDARLDIAWLSAGQRAGRELREDRRYYLQAARGRVTANGQAMQAGDALTLEQEATLDVVADSDAELLLFELA